MASVYKRGGKRAKGPWLAFWTDQGGKRRTKSTGTTDKAAALRIAKKLEADAALRRDGVIDPTLDDISRQSQRTVESHFSDFENSLKVAGRTVKHVDATIGMIRDIAESEDFCVAIDICADGVNRYSRNLSDDGKKRTDGSGILDGHQIVYQMAVRKSEVAAGPLGVSTETEPQHESATQTEDVVARRIHLAGAGHDPGRHSERHDGPGEAVTLPNGH